MWIYDAAAILPLFASHSAFGTFDTFDLDVNLTFNLFKLKPVVTTGRGSNQSSSGIPTKLMSCPDYETIFSIVEIRGPDIPACDRG